MDVISAAAKTAAPSDRPYPSLVGDDSRPGVVNENETLPWECSPEVRKMLESMGVFRDVETQMGIIRGSKNKRDIDLAKSKLDAIAKVMTIMKSGTTVYGQSAPDDDEGFSRVVVDITRPEDEQEEDT